MGEYTKRRKKKKIIKGIPLKKRMVELKTLKDVENELLEEGKGQSFLVGFSKARQEAIKHIKEIKSQMDWWNKDKEYGHLKFLEGRIFTFENFFNITKEDLK